MAKATLQKVEPVKPNILLELTPDEAEVLLLISGYVGGSPEGRRSGRLVSIGPIALGRLSFVRTAAVDLAAPGCR